MDGVGEWATTTIGWGRGNRIQIEQELRFPHSLGLLYSAFTAYCGFRFNSASAAERSIDQFRFRSALLPDDDALKVAAAVGFGLHFFKTSRSRLVLELDGDIPIERGKAFLGSFRPEEVRYRTGITYERRVAPGLYAFGYGRYDLHMPMDTAQRFDWSWGLGLGLKNQAYAVSKPTMCKLRKIPFLA